MLLIIQQHFVYRFGWFHVRHLNGTQGEPEPGSLRRDDIAREEARRKKRKSRMILMTPPAVLIIVAALWIHFTYGIADQRLLSSRKPQLDQLTEIAVKYEEFTVWHFNSESPSITGLSEADTKSMHDICTGLSGYYIDDIYGGKDRVTLWITAGITISVLNGSRMR